MTEQSETLKESLSALMDGEANELEVHRLMQSLESDRQGDLRESWQRYHLTSSAIKGETPTCRIDCSAAIADAVDDEKNHSIIPNNGIFLVLGQTAIAASVALIAILGVQQFNQPAPAIGMQSAALDPYDVNINTDQPQITKLIINISRETLHFAKSMSILARTNCIFC